MQGKDRLQGKTVLPGLEIAVWAARRPTPARVEKRSNPAVHQPSINDPFLTPVRIWTGGPRARGLANGPHCDGGHTVLRIELKMERTEYDVITRKMLLESYEGVPAYYATDSRPAMLVRGPGRCINVFSICQSLQGHRKRLAVFETFPEMLLYSTSTEYGVRVSYAPRGCISCLSHRCRTRHRGSVRFFCGCLNAGLLFAVPSRCCTIAYCAW